MQIAGDILYDVCELQSFSESHADGGHLRAHPIGPSPADAHRPFGPEFPHTTGNIVSVLIQFVQRGQRGELPGLTRREIGSGPFPSRRAARSSAIGFAPDPPPRSSHTVSNSLPAAEEEWLPQSLSGEESARFESR